ncbi:hypothetical protein KKI24_29005 [bacterium]|nr:hypothetical protein [bacterium]
MKNYLIATLLFEKKFKLYGSFDPASNILVVTQLKQISQANGIFDRESLIKELQIAKEGGLMTLVETRDKSFLKHSPIITLSDRNEDSRPYQDVYYEHFKSMYQSQQVDVGKERKEAISAFLNRVKENYDPRTGKINYEFKKFDNELRAIILLVAVHVDPPKGVNFALDIERSMGQVPRTKTKIERMKYAVGIGMDKKSNAYWEKRIEETQKNFK